MFCETSSPLLSKISKRIEVPNLHHKRDEKHLSQWMIFSLRVRISTQSTSRPPPGTDDSPGMVYSGRRPSGDPSWSDLDGGRLRTTGDRRSRQSHDGSCRNKDGPGGVASRVPRPAQGPGTDPRPERPSTPCFGSPLVYN